MRGGGAAAGTPLLGPAGVTAPGDAGSVRLAPEGGPGGADPGVGRSAAQSRHWLTEAGCLFVLSSGASWLGRLRKGEREGEEGPRGSS